MIVHVKVSYSEGQNPMATKAGTQALADFISYMDRQTDFPGVKPIFVAWQDQRPASGYGFFHCESADQMQAFLKGMPGTPRLDIVAVNDLKEMAARAISHVEAM
tara:strand:- start:1728 stop:2039 length:312 start_codon:yes stop_codon:yes gene_type:complete